MIRADALRHLKPGGYIELQDLCFPSRCIEPELNDTSHQIKWSLHCMEAAVRIGINLQAPLAWPDQLRAVGFTDIHIKWFNWPIGPWAKQKKNKMLGRYVFANFYDAVAAPNALFTRVLGWSIDEVNILLAHVRNEHKEQKVHLYQQICFAYARKPQEVREDDPTAATPAAEATASTKASG